MNILSLLNEGGFVMYPLLICSIIIWAVSFEKIWYLFQFNKSLDHLFSSASSLLKENKLQEAQALSYSVPLLLAEPYIALFQKHSKSNDEIEGRISRKLSDTLIGLKRFLWVLGTIGSSAPFIGLFGTVVGIIKSFESISSAGKGGFSVVASGLSEALIATAAGIIVAVMAVIFYNYFQNRLNTMSVNLKNRMEDLFDLI